MAWKDLADVRLENDYAQLRPIAFTDRAALADIAFDADIWRYFVQRIDADADLDRVAAMRSITASYAANGRSSDPACSQT